MQWFLAPRLSLADAVAGSTIYGVYLQSGLLPACASALGAGVLLSVGRFLAGTDK